MDPRFQPLAKTTIEQGFHWIRAHAMEEAERIALLFLAVGWTWEDSTSPPSPLEVRTTILRMIDELAGDLLRSGNQPFPYTVLAVSSGGIEVGIERIGNQGSPKAFIRFVLGNLGDLDDAPTDQTQR